MSKMIRVKLNHDDLWFIRDIIGQNVPSDEDRAPEETRTTDKIPSTTHKLTLKNQTVGVK